MHISEQCVLTTKDYTILDVMLDRCLGHDDPMAALLRQKLSAATVMFSDDIPPSVVTLNSRVVFRINDGAAETRIVAHDRVRGLVGLTIPITTRRGLALLGLTEGETAVVERADGTTETVTVLQVVYQPEAARREADQLGHAQPSVTPRRPELRLVHSSDELPERPTWCNLLTAGPDFDDPGPSAA